MEKFDKQILTEVNKALKEKKKLGLWNVMFTSFSFIRTEDKDFNIIYTTPSSLEEYQTKYILLTGISKDNIKKYKENLKAYHDFNMKRPSLPKPKL